MKNFTKKFQYKSILALLVLLPVILLLSVTFTMSKYVTEKKVGNLTLNLTSINVLLPELQFRNTLDTSVTEVVFGRTEDYEDKIIGIEPKNVDVNRRGKIKMYVKGTKAYVLSDRKIYANPNAEHMFYDLKELTAVHFFQLRYRNSHGYARYVSWLQQTENDRCFFVEHRKSRGYGVFV